MSFLWRWLRRLVLAFVCLLILLLLPVGYVEIACRGETQVSSYDPLITDPAWQRAESRTLMTYPEWHIVHAYDDYGEVISTGDPHEFGYIRAIAGFWSALCPLSRASARHGGITGETKMTIYTIGVSFTAELLAKALYEETLGRLAVALRGPERAPLDDLSARQAKDYAAFLQQVPWYQWDFDRDRAALGAAASDAFRDRERRIALGLEYRVKAAYARMIKGAVAEVGADELRLRAIVSGVPPSALRSIAGVSVIEDRPAGVLIETDRYRAFTKVAMALADASADFVEIAGNDDILFTATSPDHTIDGAFVSIRRQGYEDWRHLFLIPVPDLAEMLRRPGNLRFEHIHDY